MKLLQIAFIAVLGAACFDTFATSEALHAPCVIAEQGSNPAP
ncbi:MAG: hypothetical protein ACJAZ1_002055 [Yoonia sp.]|jgi:hypothetical protein